MAHMGTAFMAMADTVSAWIRVARVSIVITDIAMAYVFMANYAHVHAHMHAWP